MKAECELVAMHAHWKRLLMAIVGTWEVRYQLGRKAPHKGYVLEVTHAAKNVVVEQLRHWGWWDRPQRPENRCLGYNFPEGWRW